jgi:hypothetical protein
MKKGVYAVMSGVSVAEVGEQAPIAFGRSTHPRDSIRPSYDGQDHSALLALIPDFETQPRLRLDTIRIPGGYLFFGEGCDGIAATADGVIIRETALFSRGFSPPTREELCGTVVDVDEDWVTVVDCAWRNHFHLLTLAMPKLYLARQYLPNAQVVLPASRRSQSLAGELSDPLERLITIANLTRAVRRVDDGVYRVKNLHIIWSNYRRAAFLHLFDEPIAHLETLARSAVIEASQTTPPRIFIERRYNPRIGGQEGIQYLFDELSAYGFVSVALETISYEDQIQLFRNATHVVAAHGAGLSNIVFGGRSLRVLEINIDLDQQGYLRPWFLLLANAKRLYYQYLNISAGELTQEIIKETFVRLMRR